MILIRVLAIAWCILNITGISVYGDVVDFRNFNTGKSENTPLYPGSRNEQIKMLWTGNAKSLQLKTGQLDGEVVWVLSDKTHIHISHGMNAELYPAKFNHRIKGSIITHDVTQFSKRPGELLITVNHLFGNRILTTFYVLNIESGAFVLNKIDRISGYVVRPIAGSLYGQGVNPSGKWKRGMYIMKYSKNRYRKDTGLDAPPNVRLLSVGTISQNRWLIIDGKGDLVLTRKNNVIATVNGNFGLRDRTLHFNVSRNKMNNENVVTRIPPVYNMESQWAAVSDNGAPKSGIAKWTSSGSFGLIRLFHVKDKKIEETGTIGPFTGPVLDISSPPSNPSQLLWVRKTDDHRIVIEMLDLTK